MNLFGWLEDARARRLAIQVGAGVVVVALIVVGAWACKDGIEMAADYINQLGILCSFQYGNNVGSLAFECSVGTEPLVLRIISE